MKVFFEFDTDAHEIDEKLKELKEIERIMLEEAKKSDYRRKEKWLGALPEKPF